MKENGILAGNFYWFENNWHYIKKWQHLKTAGALYPLHSDQRQALLDLGQKDFSASDAIMSRCISTSISLLWTEEQIREKGEKMAAVVMKVLESSNAGVGK